ERVPRLVDHGERDGRDGARLMEQHLRGVDARELRDVREEAVPQRKRVAGMQPAVDELVDGAEVQRAERVELPDAAEVEERVAMDDAGDVPERDAERETSERHAERRPRRRTCDRS